MFWVTVRDSPQKTHFSAWVDLLHVPSQTMLHRSSSAVLSVCMCACGAPEAPEGSCPLTSFSSLATMQDWIVFCSIPPRNFPSRRDPVNLVSSTCMVYRKGISFNVSAVGAYNLVLFFPFWLIFNPRKSFHFNPWHFFKEPLLWCCIKGSLKIHTGGTEPPFSVCVLKYLLESVATGDRH